MTGGKYLHPEERKRLLRERQRRCRSRRLKKGELLLMLIGESVLVVYMIARGHMDGAFGAGLTAMLSGYFGYQLKGVSGWTNLK